MCQLRYLEALGLHELAAHDCHSDLFNKLRVIRMWYAPGGKQQCGRLGGSVVTASLGNLNMLLIHVRLAVTFITLKN